jgi:hypothetical protein
MDFPEALWWLHSSKKQGLIPRFEIFSASLSENNATITISGVTNNEQEYDLLITHCAALATTDLNGTRHASIGVADPDFGTTTAWIWRKTASAASEFQLGGMVERGILLRSGAQLWSSAVFLGADASNSLNVSGIGYYIPRLEI